MSTRVLIVDDSPTEVQVLREALERHGFTALVAHSGRAGIEIAAAEHPDVILMDIVMPGLNGFQATRQLSRGARTADIPVIMVSTKNQTTDRIWALRQGAREYLVKPVTGERLARAIHRVLSSSPANPQRSPRT